MRQHRQQNRHDAARQRRAFRLITAAAAVAAPLGVWAVARFVLGIEIASPEFGPDQPSKVVGSLHVITTAALAAGAGWGLLAALERLMARARTTWTVIAVAVLAVSLGGPFGGEATDTASRLALLAMHLAVGAVLIPGLRASARRSATAPEPRATDRDRQPASVGR